MVDRFPNTDYARDAALKLNVTPQITAANTVIMQIVLENSSPDFSRAVAGIPPINTQSAKTQVLVRDGATAVIGGPETEAGDEPVTGGKIRWPVSIAYFDNRADGAASGEQTPTYQMSFLLYENGVTRDLLMDYGDYVLSGRLESIDALEPSPCEEEAGRP